MNITSRRVETDNINSLLNNSPEKITLINKNLINQTVVPLNIEKDDSKEILFQNQPFYWRLVVLGLCMLWATNFSVVKTILQEPGIDPAMYAAVRFSLATLAMFPQTITSFGNRDLVIRGMTMGFCIFGAYVGQSMGLLTSTANKSAFICSMNVVWVALVTSILAKKFNTQIWVSVILAVIGVGFIELRGGSPPVIGDLWLLLQPIGFGTGYILLDGIMKNYPDAAGAVSGLKVMAVAIACISWAILTDHGINDLSPIIHSPVAVLGLLYTGLITTACGVWIQATAFKRVHAADAAIILSSEPLWAAVFAAILLGEHLSPTDFIGGLFIILSTASNEFNLVNTLIEKYSKSFSSKEKIDEDLLTLVSEENDREKEKEKEKEIIVVKSEKGKDKSLLFGVNDSNDNHII